MQLINVGNLVEDDGEPVVEYSEIGSDAVSGHPPPALTRNRQSPNTRQPVCFFASLMPQREAPSRGTRREAPV